MAQPGMKRKSSDIVSAFNNADEYSHSSEPTFVVPGLILANHTFKVPLNYEEPDKWTIDLFVREVVSVSKTSESLPYLLYLQGGPGFESPRPTEDSGWLKFATKHFRVILLDQRGTGKSSAISAQSLAKLGAADLQASYLTYFRADNIVRDAEVVRKALVPPSNCGGRWSILGQSFGGFCAVTYLSTHPEGLSEVLLTGGLPPSIDKACSAEDAYRSLYRRVARQNKKYYQRFPGDVSVVQRIVLHLAGLPEGGAPLPSGGRLTPRALQLLGLSGLGGGGGMERLHYLLERAFDGPDLNPVFLKGFESWMPWDTNPLYALLHESIYCQGAKSTWAAQRVREAEFSEEFDARHAAQNGRPVYFTGEMVYPWMFEDFAELRPLADIAATIAERSEWPPLYDIGQLQRNLVPVAAACYFEDMYVDFNEAQRTADKIQGIRQWVTNEYMHSGIRDDGARILEMLMSIVRGGTPLF